jgi:pimeloyl-ACP methyl ester carboxylesterase
MRTWISALPAFLVSILIAASATAQDPARFHFIEQPGPYAVGLKVVQQYDYTRTFRPLTDLLGKPYRGERARPLQTLIWYPAQKGSGQPMTVGDYVTLLTTETSFDKPEPRPRWDDWISGLAPTLKDSLWAVRDASLASGHFPVLIYAPSFGAMAWENADLCEFISSYGYVVLASPDMGATTRSMTNDVPGINAQANDISFLIGYAQSLPDADISQVAVAGFSWGGLSNLFAAARDNRIRALIALDGSMRYYAGLVKLAGDVHPEQMTIPMLFFAEGEFTLEDENRYLNDPIKNQGPNVLNAWTHGDLITLHMLGLTHVEHSSMYQRNENIWKNFAEQEKADYGREYGIPGYAWIARYTLHFLDAYLKQDAASLAWLKKTPSENGVPAHFISSTFRAGKGVPATMNALRAEIGRGGFDHVPEVYAAFHKANADFKLTEDELAEWGYDLIGQNDLPQAIAIMQLYVQLYPDAGDAYDGLGDAYAKSGQNQLAIETYKKALDKNPEATSTKVKLDKLEKAHPSAK